MKDESISNSELFQMSKKGKIVITIEKIKWEFTKTYTFIALIPFIIYNISFYIINDQFIKLFNHCEKILSSAEEYFYNVSNTANLILITSILFILCDLVVVFISSTLIFDKYTIKKEDIKKLMKSIIILQLIFLAVFSFYICITYIEDNRDIGGNINKIGKLLKRENLHTMTPEDISHKTDEYVAKINRMNLINFIILMFSAISIVTSCVFIQKKIIQNNSV